MICVDKRVSLSDPMIAAAFESLQTKDDEMPDPKEEKSQLNEIDERIANAKTVVGLLSVAENTTGLSRKHALKVSKLQFHQPFLIIRTGSIE